MSKSFVYDRYRLDLRSIGRAGSIPVAEPDAEGDYVRAKDAINREAVLQAQIRTLETQLKDAKNSQSRHGELLRRSRI